MRLTAILQCTSRLPKDYSNFPESYIKRAMAQVEWRTPNAPQYTDKVIERKKFRYNMYRPWTEGFKQANQPGTRRKFVFVQPVEWSYFLGDRVEILVGKDKGKQGVVNYIVKERNWVIVEGLNCTYRFLKSGKSGQMVKNENPLLVTNQVSLIDPTDNKPTAIEWRYTEDGKRVRVSVRTGRIIPIPLTAEGTYDYKTKSTYVEQLKDTPAKALESVTFVPKLMTFEQEIMEEHGIKEDRVPTKTYWY
ncbi:large ribosomal subunit protein uL24m-like [Ornithodoros turicata]|uniref:Large ribosomal subunit protein uL24m n=1 Tax=Ornithodoros turicata TaxID=34597 RepID=A0A2R5LHQ8_9ACAR